MRAALAARNDRLSPFWLDPQPVAPLEPTLASVTLVDAEDDFTAMLAHLLRRLGHPVSLVSWSDDSVADTADVEGVLLLGPGPGDPRDRADPRIAVLHRVAERRLTAGLPLLGVCLGHQVIALRLGLLIERLPSPDQGVQRTIEVFGRHEAVGFYNSFAAVPEAVEGVRLSLDAGRVTALRGPRVAGVQFHVESVLTRAGTALLAEALTWATADTATGVYPSFSPV